jgi:exopolysaccharide biosynthesis polyprenyl glycosylphosphotransferase
MQAHDYQPEEGESSEREMAENSERMDSIVTGRHLTLLGSADERASRARRLRFALITGRIVADGMLLALAFVAAYWLRYGLELGNDIAPESFRPLSAFWVYIAAFVAITLLTFQMRGLYALPRGASWLDHLRIITSGSIIGVAALTLGVLFFGDPVLPSRLLLIFLVVSTLTIFAFERAMYRQFRMWLWRRGINIRRALVVGAGVAGQRIMKDVVERPELGYKLAGYVADQADAPAREWRIPIRPRNGELRKLGGVKDVRRILENQELHEVIVALPATHHSQILAIIENCREYGVDFKLVPDLFEMRFNEVRIDALNGVPLIGVKDVALRGFNLLVKRGMDLALAGVGLLIAAIPMLVIAALVKITSTGPVLFKQQRVGKGGRLFVCYKFRSMYADAEARKAALLNQNEVSGPMFKMKNDPRRTPFGKFLRRSSLDELPQLFNILKGDMSLVGPRPPTPDEADKYDDWHRKRLDVTPGLTGLWQVSGRSDLSFEEMVKLDLYYAENWSPAMDLRIILKTVPSWVRGEGAY